MKHYSLGPAGGADGTAAWTRDFKCDIKATGSDGISNKALSVRKIVQSSLTSSSRLCSVSVGGVTVTL